MLGRYRAVFRAPGSVAFCAASFVMRMPIAIYPIGIVLIISARDGRYGFAGVLSACYIFGNAVGNPLLSRFVDRYGQTRLILPCAAVHAAAVLAMAIMLRTGAPNALLVVPALIFGFSYLSVASLVRTRWSYVYDGRPELATALSVESVLDEVIFVFGPLVATLLATQAEPVLVLYLGVGLVVAGSLWLATLRATEPPPHPQDGAPHASALRARGMVILTIATVGMGALFASAEVSMVAFCGQHGQRGLSGLALAAIAVGSGISGLMYGARDWHSDILPRFRLQALAFGALPLVLLAATNVPLLVVCGFVLGFGIAPTLITAFGLIQQIVPARAMTEGMAWVSTGLNVGYGAGAALVGGIADKHGARSAFLVVVAAGFVTAAMAQLLYRRLAVRPESYSKDGAGMAAPKR
ncbi:MAG: putative arabinose efflux permease, family [Jatrophihabitans sp.]|jgi:MFS family permease|nr:putative arabinose efflux permease, family [Jatrophihabitans sp.]